MTSKNLSKPTNIEELREEIVIELSNHFWEGQKYTANGRFEEVRKEAEKWVDDLISAHTKSLLERLEKQAEVAGWKEETGEIYAVPLEAIKEELEKL